VIIFAPSGGNGSLLRVSAAGGQPTPATRAEPDINHRFPVFLPDGRHFLYLVSSVAVKSGIYVASLDNPTGRRILGDQSSVIYVPASTGSKGGYLLFLRETTLMAQPFDPNTQQFGGDAFAVAAQVSTGANVGWVEVSASNSGLLIYEGGGGAGDIQVAWYDRSGKEVRKVGPPGRIQGMAISPDDKSIVLPRSQGVGASDLWLRDMERDVETRFTFSSSSLNVFPVWSPDGSRVIFGSNRGGHTDLYWKDARSNSEEEPLLRSGVEKYPQDWSRDGKFLLYQSPDPKTAYDLWVLPLDGDRKPVPFLQTEFNETQGQFSPDGRWVAYTSDESGQREVYVRPFPASAGKWRVSIDGGTSPRWRRDGKELFYWSPDHGLMAMAVKLDPVFTSATPQALFQLARFDAVVASSGGYSVSDDGQRFLMLTFATEPSLNVVLNWERAVAGGK